MVRNAAWIMYRVYLLLSYNKLFNKKNIRKNIIEKAGARMTAKLAESRRSYAEYLKGKWSCKKLNSTI